MQLSGSEWPGRPEKPAYVSQKPKKEKHLVNKVLTSPKICPNQMRELQNGRGSIASCGDTHPNPGPPRVDYQLRSALFERAIMDLHCPRPKIDAFAQPWNTLCPNWWSPVQDAFSQPWLRADPIWANPPFHFFKLIRTKISKEGAHMILLCPDWSPDLPFFKSIALSTTYLPSQPLFLREGWDPMPPPRWGVWILYIFHWPEGLTSLLCPSKTFVCLSKTSVPRQHSLLRLEGPPPKAMLGTGMPPQCPMPPLSMRTLCLEPDSLLCCGDIQPNPGPAPASNPSPNLSQCLTHLSFLNNQQWSFLLPASGPCNTLLLNRAPALWATCGVCDTSYRVTNLALFTSHDCP